VGVARFLALWARDRHGALRVAQVIALGELQISWRGSDEGEILASNEFDIPALEVSTEEEDKVEVEGLEGENTDE
jgi:segregation and condensation protein A